MEEFHVFIRNMGERISTFIHIPDIIPAPAIVFSHGFTGNKIEAHRLFVRAARKASREGFVAVRFDFRGSGESDGEFEYVTISSEISDLNTVLNFIEGREEVIRDKIGLVGLSLGGVISIITASKNPIVKAVCTWSSPAYFKPPLNSRNPILGDLSQLEKDYIDLPSGYRIRRTFFEDAQKYNILDSCAKISPRPLFIIHGSNDNIVSVEHAQLLYEKAGEPKKIVIIDGADHSFNRRDWEDSVIDLTIEWFKNNLL
ncbi:MAG: alpha/beta hydrolase [Nitrososphaerota archaeon]|nr:alpha/beta hydrolase [Nitrososphaerota archaeon]